MKLVTACFGHANVTYPAEGGHGADLPWNALKNHGVDGVPSLSMPTKTDPLT